MAVGTVAAVPVVEELTVVVLHPAAGAVAADALRADTDVADRARVAVAASGVVQRSADAFAGRHLAGGRPALRIEDGVAYDDGRSVDHIDIAPLPDLDEQRAFSIKG